MDNKYFDDYKDNVKFKSTMLVMVGAVITLIGLCTIPFTDVPILAFVCVIFGQVLGFIGEIFRYN